MDVKIESMIFGWDERIPDTLIKFINSVTLTKDEQELRGLMEVFARSKEFNRFFDMAATICGSRRGWRQTRQNA